MVLPDVCVSVVEMKVDGKERGREERRKVEREEEGKGREGMGGRKVD